MKHLYISLISTFLISCNILLNAQSYCLTMNPTDNGTTVTYNWTLQVSVSADASLQWVGTGDLSGRTAIFGGSGSGPFSGMFTRSKTAANGSFGFTINTAPPDYGVKASASPFPDLTNNCAAFALPITLSTFSATKHSDRASKLDWTTSSEINSDYFGIERSRDGDIWETIGKVTAAGNSNTELAYEYIDNLLPFSRTADQIFYYRLRLTDQDGSFKYSDIKGVNFNRQTADGVIAVYPNPATQMVHIDVVGMDESQGETKLRIFDMYGRVMLDKAILGSGLEPVDVLQYPSGVYNISVTQGDKLHQKQFIKVE